MPISYSVFTSSGGDVDEVMPNTTTVLDVQIYDDYSDLISCLTSFFFPSEGKWRAYHTCGEVIAFYLDKQDTCSATTASNRVNQDKRPFQFPMLLHLDRFLNENIARTKEIMAIQAELQCRVKILTSKVNALTNFNVSFQFSDQAYGFISNLRAGTR